jgi:hypothetical protein
MDPSLNAQRLKPGYGPAPSSEATADVFRQQISDLKDRITEQAGKLEFQETETKTKLAEIRLAKLENRALAAEVKCLSTELDIFMREQKMKNPEGM